MGSFTLRGGSKQSKYPRVMETQLENILICLWGSQKELNYEKEMEETS